MGDKPFASAVSGKAQPVMEGIQEEYRNHTQIQMIHINTYNVRVNNNTCMHKQTHVRIHQERESENEN